VGREQLQIFVATFLHDTGNYHGFNYLSAKEMEVSTNGKSVGIIPDYETQNHTYPDDSRIRFYYR
jgi:hypothetical protein